MGSLLAGWDSQISDPESVKLSRNRSLTKEEIDAYWKARKKIEQGHGTQPISSPESCAREVSMMGGHSEIPKMKKFERSSSLPHARTQDGQFHSMKSSLLRSDGLLDTKTGWWTRSSLAYLNEPPIIEEVPKSKYASQYHVANYNLASSTKPDTRIAGL